MKITIIETGIPPDALQAEFGDYRAMFADLLGPFAPDFTFEGIRVFEGAESPQPAGLEAILITGSPHSVYDDLPWIPPLKVFVRDAYAAGVPMVGICFGHQLIADALGGEVRKSEKGWGLGVHTYVKVGDHAALTDAPDAISIPASHQDQVMAPPEEATVIMRSEFSPHAGLAYGNGCTISFQPHPEFGAEYAKALLRFRRGTVFAEDEADAALASYDSVPRDNALLGERIAQFFKACAADRSARTAAE